MSKRAAKYQLTAENFEQEEEANSNDENEGEFVKASDEIISNRVIKKAKRKNANPNENSTSVFKGFAGLGSMKPSEKMPIFSSFSANVPTSKSAKNPVAESYNFMQKFTPNTTDKTPFNAFCQNSQAFSDTGKKFEGIKNSNSSSVNGLSENKAFGICNDLKKQQESKELNKEQDKDHLYVEQITELNLSVLTWIKKHVEENQLIDLTPVFNDYIKYMNEIENMYGKHAKDIEEVSSAPASSTTQVHTVAVVSPDIRRDNVNPSSSSTPLSGAVKGFKTGGVSFKAPIAEFFSTAKTSTPTVTPCSSENAENSDAEEKDDEEDQEKDSRKTIVEPEAFYTTRCKLFYKKEQEWKELGIGMLYLKPMDDKTQLLVRMETLGGNILLNILLQPQLPLNRVGKNNVSLVSVPNPPVFSKPTDGDNSKPVTYLIRVKGASEADDLAKILTDKKGVI